MSLWGGDLVAWSMVCWAVAHSGLGARHLQHTNTTLLSKWVIQVMKPSSDMVYILLREAYRHSLDWSVWETPLRGDFPVVAGIREIFQLVWSFFRLQLGDGALFRFWEDNWSGPGRLGNIFSRLYALATNQSAIVRTMWIGTWTPILPQVSSDQRLAEIMSLQICLANLRPPAETQDA